MVVILERSLFNEERPFIRNWDIQRRKVHNQIQEKIDRLEYHLQQSQES